MDTSITPHQTWNRATLPVEDVIGDIKTAVFFRKMSHEVDNAVINSTRKLQNQTPVAEFFGLSQTKNAGRYIRSHEWDRFSSPMPKDHRELNAAMLAKVEEFNNPAYRRAEQVSLLNFYAMNARGQFYQWNGCDYPKMRMSDEEFMLRWKTVWIIPFLTILIAAPFFYDHYFPRD